MTEDSFIEWTEGRTGKEQEYKVHLEADRKSPLSVFFVNYTDYFVDNYPAKFNEELARSLIRNYTKEGDLVMDPMAGSGVIPLMAYSLKRNANYFDINPEAFKLFQEKIPVNRLQQERDMKQSFVRCYSNSFDPWIFGQVKDATSEPLGLFNSVDLILTSPPFGLTIDAAHDKYSDNPNDIGNSKDYEQWRKGMKKIIKNCFDVLKPGKLAIFETRPRSKNGHSYPLNMWIWQDAEEVGFEFFSERIEVVIPLRMWSFGKKEQRVPMPMHSYLTMMRKPENEKLM